MTVFDVCIECDDLIGWIECPTGGWWRHLYHPADDHDARPESGPLPAEVEA